MKRNEIRARLNLPSTVSFLMFSLDDYFIFGIISTALRQKGTSDAHGLTPTIRILSGTGDIGASPGPNATSVWPYNNEQFNFYI